MSTRRIYTPRRRPEKLRRQAPRSGEVKSAENEDDWIGNRLPQSIRRHVFDRRSRTGEFVGQKVTTSSSTSTTVAILSVDRPVSRPVRTIRLERFRSRSHRPLRQHFRINEVALRRARLVLEWVTVSAHATQANSAPYPLLPKCGNVLRLQRVKAGMAHT